jgi:hypothetical protein
MYSMTHIEIHSSIHLKCTPSIDSSDTECKLVIVITTLDCFFPWFIRPFPTTSSWRFLSCKNSAERLVIRAATEILVGVKEASISGDVLLPEDLIKHYHSKVHVFIMFLAFGL